MRPSPAPHNPPGPPCRFPAPSPPSAAPAGEWVVRERSGLNGGPAVMDRRDFFLGVGGASVTGLATSGVRADPPADAMTASRLTPDGARVVEPQRDVPVT